MIDSSRPRAKAITSVTQEQEEVFPQCSAAAELVSNRTWLHITDLVGALPTGPRR
jgi:hypothetical protein